MKLNSPLLNYLSDIRRYIYISAVMFTASVVTGYSYAYFVPEKSIEFFSTLQQVMAQRFGGMDAGFMALTIFMNNFLATFIMLVTGIFFGLLPGMGLILNGFILGVVAYIVTKKSVFMMVTIIPHGVFEIPVFLVSAAMGLRLGHQVVRKFLQNKDAGVLEELRKGLYFYFRWGVPFLFVAAFIEAYLSLRLVYLLK